MTRDGEGSRVKVILPYGTGFDDVVKAKADAGVRPGRGPLAGLPDPGQDQPPPPHAVGGRP